MRVFAAGWVVTLGLVGCWGDLDADGFDAELDCDDEDARIHPRALEIGFDGLDNDCEPDTVDYCEVRQPCTAQDCSFEYAFERFAVSGTARVQGAVLPQSDEPVAEILFVSTEGHRVSVDLFGGEAPWAVELPAGTWQASMLLAEGVVDGGAPCWISVAEELVVDSAQELDVDARPVSISGVLTYRGRPLPEGATGTVSLEGCASSPVDDQGRYSILAPEGAFELSASLDGDTLPIGSALLGELEVSGDTTRDIDLRGLSLSGSVDVRGLPDGAEVQMMVDGRVRATVVEGRYLVETFPGNLSLGIRVEAESPEGGRARTWRTLTTRALKKDTNVDLSVTLFPVDLVGPLIDQQELPLTLRFTSPRSRAEVELGAGQRVVPILRDRYRLVAGHDLDQVALSDQGSVSVDGSTLVRLEARPVELSGDARIDGQPVEQAPDGVGIRFVDRRRGNRWTPDFFLEDGYRTQVTEGSYDVFLDGISEEIGVGTAVAARGRWLTGDTAFLDIDLSTVPVEIDVLVDGRGVDGEVRLLALPTTRRIGSARGARLGPTTRVTMRDGAGDARVFAGGAYTASVELVEGDVTSELRLEDCLFVGEGPPD